MTTKTITETPRKPRRRRLLVLCVMGLIVVGGAAAYVQWWLARPIGSGPAGPPVPREAFAKPWSDRPVLLLGIGDSITAGLGADGADHSYFARLFKNPDDEYADMQGVALERVLPNIRSRNVALSGSTSIEHLRACQRLERQPLEVFGIVAMTTGGNDLIHSYGRSPPREGAMYGATLAQAKPWIANFEPRLNQMLDLIDDSFPGGCAVYLADIYDPTDGVGDAASVFLPAWPDGLAIHAQYNAILHRCAEERANVCLVPLHRTFLGHGSHCRQFWRANYDAHDPHYWFYENIEDPNDRGYDAIRRVFLNTMLESELATAIDAAEYQPSP
jgi:hypothetical protein